MFWQFLFGVTNTFAATKLCSEEFGRLCQLTAQNSNNIVGNIINILLILAIILTLIYLIYGGIKYITSGGDKTKLDSARSHITSAIIGLVIALTAFFIVNLLIYFFTGSSDNKFSIPKLVP